MKSCREKLRGILRYERLYGPWRIFLPNRGRTCSTNLAWENFDGIISGNDAGLPLHCADTLRNIPVALIDYGEWNPPFQNQIQIRCDNEEIGEMGAEYLLELGMKHFAFVEQAFEVNWSIIRRLAFEKRIAKEGFDCSVFSCYSARDQDSREDTEALKRWLLKLPHPTGIMTANDARGLQVLYACQEAGRNVPQEMAILGVDDDEMLCQMGDPSLSSLLLDCEQGGFLAAELLDKRMRGKEVPPQTLHYQTLRVCERRSTSIHYKLDPFIVEVKEFIEENAWLGISVADIVAHCQASRSTLERAFKQAYRCTLLEEIQRVRFERVCRFLLETDLTVAEIASLCGFRSVSALSFQFKKRFGKTTGEFRRNRR
ncbi:MAG: DNA-binding transcriptional regulator [Planctomycetia bacterium]|nr:DNA-binding transcriptional regulator [Planctomycetia bacterium]